MSSDIVEAHIYRALLALADLAANSGLPIEKGLLALAATIQPGPSGRA